MKESKTLDTSLKNNETDKVFFHEKAPSIPSTSLPSLALTDQWGERLFKEGVSGLDLQDVYYPYHAPEEDEFLSIAPLNQPIIAHVPHAGTHRLKETALHVEMALFKINALSLTDWLTDDLFSVIYNLNEPGALGGGAVINRLNRFFFDPERYADRSIEPMESVGMGVFYSRGCSKELLRSALSENAYAQLIERYYRPYHEALSQMSYQAYQHFGELVIVDCHSYPEQKLDYEITHNTKRPDICLGVNDMSASANLIRFWEKECLQWGFSFEVNEPFGGALIPGSINGKPRVLGFMIELNRRTYLDQFRVSSNYLKIKTFLSQTIKACFHKRRDLYHSI